ncbi:MAG: LuxR C-terminal-related transcriptional regulator, partial [Rhodobacteraceae bacterium]|nr:LuxR C-terminal-related transcriptional regulator [Paracoccaceae bacterium]
HGSIFCADDEARIHYAANSGWNSVLALPIETHVRDRPSLVVFASAVSKHDFLALIRERGWLIHVLSMDFARIYLSNLRRDAVQRIGLTARQRELLYLTAQGYSTKQIAHATGVTEQAVSKTMRKISGHFGTATRVGIVARAAQLGMFDTPELNVED